MESQTGWKNMIYSLLISGITDLCYANALARIREKSLILDIGIGNGLMLRKWHQTIKTKKLRIIGLDTDAVYLDSCKRLIEEFGLDAQVGVAHVAIENFTPKPNQKFDVIFFSMSFMLMTDPRAVLDRVKPWLTQSGEIVFVQTMFRTHSWLRQFIKPKLKYFTTIDFGRPTHENDFFALLRSAGLTVTSNRLLRSTVFGGDLRLIAAKPDV